MGSKGKHWKIKDTSKMGLHLKGKKRPPFSPEWKKKLSESHKGPFSPERRKALSIARSGKNSPGYIDGRSEVPGYKARKARDREIKIRFGNIGSYTVGDWETLKAQYNWTCPSCGKKEPDMKYGKLTQDHIIPLSKGGSNNIENIQPLCLKCNLSKMTKIVKYPRPTAQEEKAE